MGGRTSFVDKVCSLVAEADSCLPEILSLPFERSGEGLASKPDTVVFLSCAGDIPSVGKRGQKERAAAVSASADAFRRAGVMNVAVVAGLGTDAGSAAMLREAALKAHAAFIEARGLAAGDDEKLAERVLATLGIGKKLPRSRLRVRDPYVVPDREAQLYRLYETYPWFGGAGVYMRKSRDLKTWSEKKLVTVVSPELGDTVKAWWAPEMHEYKGKYYLLVTLHRPDHDPVRGTWAFRADSPDGPFVPVSGNALTPKGWDSLDGTLWVEDGKPYLVFGHSWGQVGDGTMEVVGLKDDLSGPTGESRTLFKGTDYTRSPMSDSKRPYVDHVAEGPYMFRSAATGRLHMLWSNLLPSGYAVMISDSAGGSVEGPWQNHRVLYGKDGGHGMFFRTLEGRLTFTLHQPNGNYGERMQLFEFSDAAAGPEIKDLR